MEFNYKKILSLILIAIAAIGLGAWLVYRVAGEKSLRIISPNGEEIWQANKTYQITWKAKNIGRVGIMLVKDKTPKESEWIVKDYPAGKGKYDWQIFTWQEPRQDYKIAVVEYPWKEGNKIDYSDKNFTIVGPTFASCDELSIRDEWPYLPSDFPNLRKVFITDASFDGNLGGLEGADQKCQTEAENKGLEGTWKAFLGDDKTSAVERLNLEGIFVEAQGEEVLPQGKIPSYFWKSYYQFLKKTKLEEKTTDVENAYNLLGKYFDTFLKEWEGQQEKKTCHRLLGKNFDEFFKKLSDPLAINQEKFQEEFLKSLSNLRLGRVNKESKKECITIFTQYPSSDPSLRYSFTLTCQNWTINAEKIPNYPPKSNEKIELPVCYTPEGVRINAAALAGLSSGLIEESGKQVFATSLGKSCDTKQRLLCIQQ